MLLFRLRTIWKTVDGKFYPTCLIAQTLLLLTTICSGRCRTPSLEYGSHLNRVLKIGLIHSWPPSRHSSFRMESTNFDRKMGRSHSFRWEILWIILLYMFFLNQRSNFEKKKPHELSYKSNMYRLTNGRLEARILFNSREPYTTDWSNTLDAQFTELSFKAARASVIYRSISR